MTWYTHSTEIKKKQKQKQTNKRKPLTKNILVSKATVQNGRRYKELNIQAKAKGVFHH